MKLLLPILLLFFSFGVFSQKEITWDDLVFEFEEKWSEEYQVIYIVPLFDKKHKDLEQVKIKIKGYLTFIDINETLCLLSKNAQSFGGFCGLGFQNNAYELIEIEFKSKPNFEMNKRYWIEGTLILNEDDILQLNYILKDAVIVKR
jgi:hypothetical protein